LTILDPVSSEASIVTDATEWQALIDGPFREVADIYHHPDFVALEARRIGATPGLVVAEVAGRTVGLSLLFRPIPGHPELCDATSVYGYNGLLYSSPTGEPVPLEALAAIERALYLRGCVAVFNRSHPLRPAQLPGRALSGETLLLDLAAGQDAYLHGLAEGHAYDLRRMRAAGLCAEVDREGKHLEAFHQMYLATMNRHGATAGYRFPLEVVRGHFRLPSNAAQLWLAWDGDRLAASALFFRGRHCAHYHLSASDRQASKHPATKLILDAFIRSEIALGQRTSLHLGGGVGAAVDSLNQFKRGFGAQPVPFVVTRWIVRPADYDLLSEGHADADYFPLYRSPI
jgi:hypothetical protein